MSLQSTSGQFEFATAPVVAQSFSSTSIAGYGRVADGGRFKRVTPSVSSFAQNGNAASLAAGHASELTAADFIGYDVLEATGTLGAGATITLPTAAEFAAAFGKVGITRLTGISWDVHFGNKDAGATHSITFVAGANGSLASSPRSLVVTQGTSCVLRFTFTDEANYSCVLF